MGILEQAVMFDLPDTVITEAVGKFGLLEAAMEQSRFVTRSRISELHLEKQGELHRYALETAAMSRMIWRTLVRAHIFGSSSNARSLNESAAYSERRVASCATVGLSKMVRIGRSIPNVTRIQLASRIAMSECPP